MPRLAALLLLVCVTSSGASAASQVHVTYTGEDYAVTFVSDSQVPVPVRYEPGGAAFAEPVEAEDGDADRTFRAHLPAQALTYEVEGRSFALPAPPAADEATRVVFVADIGTDANANRVIDAISEAEPDLLVVGGDLSYANGDPSVWNEWFVLMEPLASRVPMMPAYGNHEDYCEREGGRLEHCGPGPNGWRAHFALPNEEKLYYAFDWGPIHFTMLDSEAYVAPEPTTNATEQEAFVDASLDEDERAWDVVVYHRPLRTTNARDGIANDAGHEALAPLLEGRADLVLQGHLHAYERAHATNGTHYVTSGGGGRMLYDDWGAMEPWVAKRAAAFHFLVLDATPTELRMRAVLLDRSTLDEIALDRPAPPPTPPASPTPTAQPTPTAVVSEGTTPAPSQHVTSEATGNASGPDRTPWPGVAPLLAIFITLSRRRRRRLAQG